MHLSLIQTTKTPGRQIIICLGPMNLKKSLILSVVLVVIFSSLPLAYLVWDKALDECPRSASWNSEEWGITEIGNYIEN